MKHEQKQVSKKRPGSRSPPFHANSCLRHDQLLYAADPSRDSLSKVVTDSFSCPAQRACWRRSRQHTAAEPKRISSAIHANGPLF